MSLYPFYVFWPSARDLFDDDELREMGLLDDADEEKKKAEAESDE